MKSYIVKLKETGEYFQVEYYITTISKVAFTKNKKKATIFQQGGDETIAPNGIDKISFNKIRSTEFSFFLHQRGIKTNDITVEELDAPIQPLLTKKQQREIKEEFKLIKNHGLVTTKIKYMKKELREQMLEAIFIQTGGREENPKIAEICAELAVNFITTNAVLVDSLPISKGEIGQCLIDAQTLLEDTWRHTNTKPDLMHEHRWKVARLLKPKLANLR